MNKYKKRIIFSSISIILIVALIGGTLAWFYLNERVGVDYGNSIFCEAGNSLEIALVENGEAKGWSSMIDYSAGSFTTVDISGDGNDLFRPAEINEMQQPVSFEEAVSSLDDSSAFDYVDLEVAFRSMSKMNVYLSGESFIEPANPEDDGKNMYGKFSRDYIAGAMRVGIVEGSDVKMIWAPNSQYQLIKNSNGSYDFRNGEDNNSKPESSYSYYVKKDNGEIVERTVSSDDYANKKFVVDSTGTRSGYCGNSPVLVSLNPEDDNYDVKNVKIRIWFEGTDREADQALAGGNVKVKLKFAGVYKEQAEADKQAAISNIEYNEMNSTFSGLQNGMVFSTDGRNWTEYNSATTELPTITSGTHIYFKYPETATNYETTWEKFPK